MSVKSKSLRRPAQRSLFVQLSAYQHHAFLDFRVVEGGEWEMVNGALNGAGVESVQGKWEEMFGEKARPERSRMEVKEENPKKPAKKRAARKRITGEKKKASKSSKTKKKAD